MRYKVIFGMCLALILAGCTTISDTKYSYQVCCGLVGYIPGLASKTVQLRYPGAVRPLEDVGVVSYNADLVVKVKDSDGNDVKIFSVYGKKGIDANGLNQQHFLPGTYTFVFGFYRVSYAENAQYSSIAKSIYDITKVVTIEKGDIIHFTYTVKGRQWSLIQKDDSAEKDKVKADYEEAIKIPLTK
jgi:hypothetical protein